VRSAQSAPRTGHTQISRGRCNRRAARRAERHLAKDFEASSLLPLPELDRVGDAMSLLQSLGDEPLATDTERPTQRGQRGLAAPEAAATPEPAAEARNPRISRLVAGRARCASREESGCAADPRSALLKPLNRSSAAKTAACRSLRQRCYLRRLRVLEWRSGCLWTCQRPGFESPVPRARIWIETTGP
jgi:hypothetical protein